MTTEYSLNIDFKTDVSVSDVISQNTLDVSVLKQDSPEGKIRAHVDEVEANDAREMELDAIAQYIATNGVTKPTEADYEPKAYSWRGKRSTAKKDNKSSNGIESRGRPRTKFHKDLAFVCVSNNEFKRAGRGRARKGEIRETFEIHHTNVDAVCEGTHTRKSLVAMANTIKS